MKQFTFLAVTTALALTACETIAHDKQPDPTLAILSGDDCPVPEGGGYLYTFERPSLQVGETFLLQPYFSTHPGSIEVLPGGCVGDLSARPAGSIRWSRLEDGIAVATVTDTAEPGEPILLQSRYAGSQPISLRISVYEKAANPLTGVWSQIGDEDCAPSALVNELIFRADGTFSVTWTPFESYKDYWGRYEYDLETSILNLMPEQGNYIPDTIASGKIKLEDESFQPLDGMSFGPNRQGQVCDSGFRKRS